MPLVNHVTIPKATVARLPLYLQCLQSMADAEITVSSETLAQLANLNPAKVRKDLSYLGSHGVRGVGYDRLHLCLQIKRELGLVEAWPVVIVGVGNLGSALANYGGFGAAGFSIAGIYDADPKKVGTVVDEHVVQSFDELPADVRRKKIAMAIITTPAGAAQEVADVLIAAGITSILNFAPAVLQTPEGVECRHVDLATELQILSYYQARQA